MANVTEFKCPSCGGSLEFNTDVQKMKCPYCDSELDVEALKDLEAQSIDPLADSFNWKNESTQWGASEAESVLVYSCKSCGGEIIAEHTTAASSCPYCDNFVVMHGNVSGSLKPDFVIPFKLNKQEAIERFKKHLQGKKLLNNVFKDANHIEEIKGMYVPFWLFDANAQGRVLYKATKISTRTDSNYRYTTTRYFSVIRAGALNFLKVPVDASEKMDDALMDSLEPYNFDEAVDFQTAYLSGYLADKYDVSEEMSIGRANNRIKASLYNALRDTVNGYASVSVASETINVIKGSSHYALYPVWILNTRWNDKLYTFAMNGQTGKFVGDLPVDKKARTLHFLKYTAIASIITYALAFVIVGVVLG